MVVLGLVLIALGALAIVAAVFTAEGIGVELLGIDMSATAVFLLGLAAGVAIQWGFSISKFGTKRSFAQRREQKRLEELSAKLNDVESDRRRDGDHLGDDPRH
ncbi:hypothetical protein [Nocardioides sp. SYSU D00038]|uniref:hypothetical protein n=1 Tax=Nocardioides sp. SYSU D00038 TaxID=2812554 RepID=UPI001968492D|nr:hypothetical protein [Nocardioides sp. SYSU D00038]